MTTDANGVEILTLYKDIPGVGSAGSYLIHAPSHDSVTCAVVKPVDPSILPAVRQYLSRGEGDHDQAVAAALRRSHLHLIQS